MAIRTPAAVVAFIVTAAAGLAGDLLSKHYVFQWLLSDPALPSQIRRLGGAGQADDALGKLLSHDQLRPYVQQEICLGVRFRPSVNPGVVFGLDVPRSIVSVATIIALGLVLFLFTTADSRARSVHVALAMILAGALGNLYDRLAGQVLLPGAGAIRYQVRDFIDCTQLYYPWVFNVADVLLVVGVALLALHWWRSRRAEAAGDAPARKAGHQPPTRRPDR